MEPIDPMKSVSGTERTALGEFGSFGSTGETKINSESEARKSIATSLIVRILGLFFCIYVSNFYVSHYPGNFDSLVKPISSAVPSFLFVAICLIVICGGLFWIIYDLHHSALKDRDLSIPAISSNIIWLLFKPVRAYFFWTFVAFLFPSIQDTWLIWLFSALITWCTDKMKFRDRRSKSAVNQSS